MKNLGAKLKSAREAMQLSLRDVADATRLRIPVIEKMEDGSFDYDLQDIYKRGFLRIYAAFLKLNVDDVMREYNTALAMRPAEDARKRFVPAADDEPAQATKFDDPEDASEEAPDMSGKYIKLGGALVLAVLAIIVVVMIASSLTKSQPQGDLQTAAAQQQPAPQAAAPKISEVAVSPAKMKISAYGETYITVSKAANHGDVLFTGTLKEGASREFNLDEPLFVRVTDASKIKITRGDSVIYDKSRKGILGFNVTPR